MPIPQATHHNPGYSHLDPACLAAIEKHFGAKFFQYNNFLAANWRRFAVKKHRASRLHYDLRFEFEGTLLSWALPEGPSYHAGEHRIAIQMDDHDPRYIISERVIPAGQTGAGPVMLWDEGSWIASPGHEDIRACMRMGHLRFTLACHKLKGIWTLRRRPAFYPREPRPIWYLIKEEDQFARGEDAPDILVEAPNSVSTGRTLEEIEQGENKRKSKLALGPSLFEIA